jgi:H+-transporting ATPase
LADYDDKDGSKARAILDRIDQFRRKQHLGDGEDDGEDDGVDKGPPAVSADQSGITGPSWP